MLPGGCPPTRGAPGLFFPVSTGTASNASLHRQVKKDPSHFRHESKSLCGVCPWTSQPTGLSQCPHFPPNPAPALVSSASEMAAPQLHAHLRPSFSYVPMFSLPANPMFTSVLCCPVLGTPAAVHTSRSQHRRAPQFSADPERLAGSKTEQEREETV